MGLSTADLQDRSAKLEAWLLSRRAFTVEHAVYGLASQLKEHDGSVVTLIDKANDKSFYDDFASVYYPDEVVISEEGDEIPQGPSSRNWLVDPIDGTANLKRNINGLTSICAALAEDGVLVLSQIYDWTNDVLYKAIKGHGAIASIGQPDGSRSEFVLEIDQQAVQPKYINFERSATGKYDILEAQEAFHAQGIEIRNASASSMTAIHVITGHNAAVISTSEWAWDGVASLIVSEAGGVATDLYGNPLRYDHVETKGMLVSATPAVHAVVLDTIRRGTIVERSKDDIQVIKKLSPF